jgi:LPS O-antigen subunit length determinant protein (WzzB/FepE family)
VPQSTDSAMPDHKDTHVDVANEPDIKELFADILRLRWRIFVSIAICVLLAVVYLHMAKYKYTATLKIVPTASAGSGLGNKLGGLASLAGVSLPGDLGNANFEQYGESLYSLDVAETLANNKTLMHEIFPEQWNAKKESWEQPGGVVSSLAKAVKSLLGVPVQTWTPPGPMQLQDYIVKNVKSGDKPKKSLTILDFSHTDQKFAPVFLLALHEAADNQLRQRALMRSSLYISYLTEKLKTVVVAEHRQALSELLSSQEKMRMVASSTAPYAAEKIGAPVVSMKPSSPKPLVVLPAGIIFGAMLPILLIVMSWYFRSMKTVNQ